jgi:outer membrane protein insertion porin family
VYSYASGYLISDVLIKGLRNVSLKSVLSVIDLKKGNHYSKYQARKDVTSIAGLGYFNDVKFYFNKQSGIIVFEVNEDPFIERIVFRGNSGFSTRKLNSISTLKEKDYYDFSKLEETKKKINTLYRNKGYVDCRIEVYPTINVDTNKMTITFLITENNRIVVGGVKIKGMVYFKEKELLKIMKIKLKKIFKEDVYRMDLKSIETFYKNNGFVDYEFVSLTAKYNDAKTEIFLTLNINEGNKYKVGSVTCSGNFVIDDKQMKKIIKIKEGEIFDQHRVEETVNNIHEYYFNEGYLKVVVKPCFSKEDINGVINVNFLVEENEVFYLGNVYISGLVSTKDKVLRREMLLKTGQVLMKEKLLRSIERIYNLGFIENVEYNELPTEASDTIDIGLHILESTKKSVGSVSIGYSSSAFLTGLVQLQHINMFGLGQKLNLICEIGKRRKNYEISWMEPWIFDKNMSLTLNVYKRNDIESRGDHLDNSKALSTIVESDRRTGVGVDFGPRISERITLSFGYGYENVDFYSTIAGGTEEREKGKISSVLSNFLYDSRNYIFNPSKGNVQLVALKIASDMLGGNKNFVRGIANSTWYFPTFLRFVLSANLRAGLVTSYWDRLVPIYEKFHIGGVDSVRGYDRDEPNLHDGGEFMGVMNIEYRFPIFSNIKKTIIQGFLFYDVGGAWKRKEIGKKFYQSVGFGIRMPTPILPIKLDWAYRLDGSKGKGKGELKFYFTLGRSIF